MYRHIVKKCQYIIAFGLLKYLYRLLNIAKVKRKYLLNA